VNVDIDLAVLAQDLRRRMHVTPAVGYLRGKAILREFVRELLACSDLESEELVDTLELRQCLRFTGDPSSRPHVTAPWVINPTAGL
jgi:hypothetical protein